MCYLAENIEALKILLPMPLIGAVHYYPDDLMSFSDKIHHASSQIDIKQLL